MQEKEDKKVVFVSLSLHTNLEHDEHTQKKNPDQPITDLMKHLQKIIKL